MLRVGALLWTLRVPPNESTQSVARGRSHAERGNEVVSWVLDSRDRAMKWLAIVLQCVATCVVYGVIHDQFTVRICLEYFTIGHPPVFPTVNPTLLALGWGVIASWWVGVLVGIPLASSARFGSWPKREPRTLVRPLIYLMAASFVFAGCAGVAGWIAASNGWVHLTGRMAKAVPADRHIPFLVDLWSHDASYLAGTVGGFTLIIATLFSRQSAASTEAATNTRNSP